ncbi:hypothetical protein V3C99_018098 [Haemonchus contortus]|uniref:Reverse transcriptase domain-containing protein n=1 Tax=Haemonchus contortus TaxID=6289 RepID=A0A7I4Z470_HAECO
MCACFVNSTTSWPGSRHSMKRSSQREESGWTGQHHFAQTFQCRSREHPHLECGSDGRYLHHLRFADDIVLITPNIEQAEHLLAEFDSACGKFSSRLSLTKTMFEEKIRSSDPRQRTKIRDARCSR